MSFETNKKNRPTILPRSAALNIYCQIWLSAIAVSVQFNPDYTFLIANTALLQLWMMYFWPPAILIVTVLLLSLNLCVEQMDSITFHRAEHRVIDTFSMKMNQ